VFVVHVLSSGRVRILASSVFAAFVLLALASSASAIVVHERNGHALSVAPRQGVSAAAVLGSFGMKPSRFSSGPLLYHGGPVIHSSAPYVIYWVPSGQSIAANEQTLINRYFTDVAANSSGSNDVYSVNRQYTDGSGFADYKQTFNPGTQVLTDTTPYPTRDFVNCPDTAPTYPTCLTDAQLQAELTALIAAHSLPTGIGANAPMYFMVTPSDVNICADSLDCSDNVFCAYHSVFNDGGSPVLYSAEPLFFNGASSAQDPKACQFDGHSQVQEPNGNLADVALKYMSHEQNETITDPLLNAYYDAGGSEDGDLCNSIGNDPNAFLPTLGGNASAGTLFDQLINSDQYYIQSEWSNGQAACKMQPTAATISPAFTAPTGTNMVGTNLSFDPSASSATNPISSTTWTFGDGASAFAASSPALVQHAYSAAGTYTVTLTLVDKSGNVQSTSHQVTVIAPPTASFSVSPAQPVESSPTSFNATGSTDPNTGGSITSYSWNFGDGATGTGPTPVHTYASHGVYTVTLTVSDNFGLTSAPTTKSVTVADETPTANFSLPYQARAGGAALFSFTASDPDGAASAHWNYGDGHSGSSAQHVYKHPGTYTVTLTVTGSNGETASVSHSIKVGKPACVVVDLKGDTPGRAKALIKAENCKVGRVNKPKKPNHKPPDHKHWVEEVVGQSPRKGKIEKVGAKVNLTLSWVAV
jgi:PKD repeat protein